LGDEKMTFEEAQEALEDLINELPSGIFRGLNCGVTLIPDTLHDKNGLLILGRYHVEPTGLGKYITINYGSLMQAHGHLPPHRFIGKLKNVLHHELTHHLEHLAGDRSLEIKDAQDIRKMLAER
jgi:hypothetical protein